MPREPDADPSASPPDGRRRFLTTRWSLVLAVAGDGTEASRRALEDLCRTYWYPLYAFIRRWGHDPDGAADLTQEFFADILRREAFRSVDPARGRFRTFLLTCCTHFLCNARRNEARRGPSLISIEAGDAERRYRFEPADALTPEGLFDRRWALSVLERALDTLRDDYRRAGKSELFARLEPTLAGRVAPGGLAAVAGELGMTEGAVQVAAHRLRRRYREAIRELIAETVETPEQVDDELAELFRALSRPDSPRAL